ncbi:hypothetical protein PENTCL1PPCAC_6168, partial [Pristionchus entomophagus]
LQLVPMIRLLFVSAAVVAAASAAPTPCTDAQMNTIVKCYTDFYNAYGSKLDFPGFKDYLNPGGFHEIRTGMLNADGIAAKPTIAKYGKSLTDCLQPVADCIVDNTYQQAPLSSAGEGHRYNFDRVMTAYESTDPGYSYQMRHYFCFAHFKEEKDTNALRQKVTACDDDLTAKTVADPYNPNNCKAYQDNAECYRSAYAEYCNADEAGEFWCMIDALEFQLYNPDCVFDCKKH